MDEMKNIHDRTFKASMKDMRVAREFFEHYLPRKILSIVDLATLKLSPNSYIDESLNSFSSDILYEVKLKDSRLGFLYVLAEHQSTVDPLMPYRVWNYKVRIWADYIKQTRNKAKTLPLIFPLIFYNGKKQYDGCRNLREIIEAPREVVDEELYKDFHLIDTHDISNEELRNQHWAGILAFAFKYVYARDIWPHMDALIKMMGNIQHENGAVTYINNLLKYWIVASDIIEPKKFIEAVQQGLDVPIQGEVMTIAERFRLAGEGSMFIRLMEKKFDDVPNSYKEMIKQANSEKLLKWGDKFVEGKNLEDIFEEEH